MANPQTSGPAPATPNDKTPQAETNSQEKPKSTTAVTSQAPDGKKNGKQKNVIIILLVLILGLILCIGAVGGYMLYSNYNEDKDQGDEGSEEEVTDENEDDREIEEVEDDDNSDSDTNGSEPSGDHGAGVPDDSGNCVATGFDGLEYGDGDSYTTLDGCETCTCNNGSWDCTVDPSCTVPAGGCTYDGSVYNNGDSFPASDGCNTCTCNNGNVNCTLMLCP